jgi:hypothetical protein
VSDIFSEVDEEVRREQLKRLWDRYGTLAIIAAVIAVVAVAGWRGYQYYEAKQAAAAGAQFDAAADLIEQGKAADAEAALAKIAAEGTSGYRTLARLRLAAVTAERDPKAAVSAYDGIASDGSVSMVFQALAGVRAGMLRVYRAPRP